MKNIRTLSDDRKAFVGGGEIAAVVDQYGYFQLHNLAENTIIVNLHRIHVTTDETYLFLMRYDTPFANAVPGIGNKYLGGAAPVADLWYHQSVNILGTSLGILPIKVVDNYCNIYFRQPFSIPPGTGFQIRTANFNKAMYASFHWDEREIWT